VELEKRKISETLLGKENYTRKFPKKETGTGADDQAHPKPITIAATRVRGSEGMRIEQRREHKGIKRADSGPEGERGKTTPKGKDDETVGSSTMLVKSGRVLSMKFGG